MSKYSEYMAALTPERKAEVLTQRRAAKSRWGKRQWERLRAGVFAVLGVRCVGCNEADTRVLTVDHIAGRKGLWQNRQQAGDHPRKYYQRIIDEGDAAKGWARILCWNCQFRAARDITLPNEIK